MSKIWFTSDLHLNNKNIIKYCNRPYADQYEMNKALIENWNSKVSEDDTVYVLGDFIMGMADTIPDILAQLKGNIHLIRGNHDSDVKMDYYAKAGIPVSWMDTLSYKGKYFIMCHFPIENQQLFKCMVGDNSEIIFLYGHIHDNAPHGYVNKTFHVGVDTNNYMPVDIETIYQESLMEDNKNENC